MVTREDRLRRGISCSGWCSFLHLIHQHRSTGFCASDTTGAGLSWSIASAGAYPSNWDKCPLTSQRPPAAKFLRRKQHSHTCTIALPHRNLVRIGLIGDRLFNWQSCFQLIHFCTSSHIHNFIDWRSDCYFLNNQFRPVLVISLDSMHPRKRGREAVSTI